MRNDIRVRVGRTAQAEARVSLISSSAETDTTDILRGYAQASGAVRIVVGEHTTLTRFLGELAQALGAALPGIRRTLWGAHQRARQTPDPIETLAGWFGRHLGDCDLEIIVEGVDRASETAFVRFVAAAIERSPQSCRWVLTGKSFENFPVASWLSRGVAQVVPSSEMTAGLPAPERAAPVAAAGALALLFSTANHGELLELIARHGFALIEGDEAYVLHDAVAALNDSEKSSSAAVQTLLAMSASLDGLGDVAEALFLRAIAVSTNEEERSGARYYYACDLLRKGRPDAIPLYEATAAVKNLPSTLAIANRAALGAAYAIAGRTAPALQLVNAAMADARDGDDDALYARTLHQASFVALCDARYDDAERLAGEARMRAEQAGAYETAAGAASVQYNVLCDVREDVDASIEALRFLADCGGKCGSLEKQLYALSGAYDIEVERGDQDAIAAIEMELREFDVAYGMRTTDEVVVPSQAMQVAWTGDFSRPYQMLKSSGERQTDAGRRALRWAETALYAVAASNARNAEAAIDATRRHVAEAETGNAQRARARAYLSLALTMSGRPDEGLSEASSLAAELSPAQSRLHAFADLSQTAAHWSIGAANDERLIGALENVRERGLGGVARLFESLPLALVPAREKIVAE